MVNEDYSTDVGYEWDKESVVLFPPKFLAPDVELSERIRKQTREIVQRCNSELDRMLELYGSQS
jgi:hypothetical protein